MLRTYTCFQVSLTLNITARLAVTIYLEHKAGIASEGSSQSHTILLDTFFFCMVRMNIIKNQQKNEYICRYKYETSKNALNQVQLYFNLTLHWHVMPKTGKMFADKIWLSFTRCIQMIMKSLI